MNYKKAKKTIYKVDGMMTNYFRPFDQGAFHFAVFENDRGFINNLKQATFNMDEKDKFGNTALHYAIYDRNFEMVKFLVEKGANLKVKNNKGNTPLHVASFLNQFEIANYLSRKNPRLILEKNNNGDTPLHISSFAGNYAISEMFVEKEKRAIDVQNKFGDTPWHYAMQNTTLQDACNFSDLFYSNGATLVKNKQNKTPCDICRFSVLKESLMQIFKPNEVAYIH